MIEMTSVSEWPVTEPGGTIGAGASPGSGVRRAARAKKRVRRRAPAGGAASGA
jgi:hypothetical protein